MLVLYKKNVFLGRQYEFMHLNNLEGIPNKKIIIIFLFYRYWLWQHTIDAVCYVPCCSCHINRILLKMKKCDDLSVFITFFRISFALFGYLRHRNNTCIQHLMLDFKFDHILFFFQFIIMIFCLLVTATLDIPHICITILIQRVRYLHFLSVYVKGYFLFLIRLSNLTYTRCTLPSYMSYHELFAVVGM